VYFVAADNNLYALNAGNGNFLWSHELPEFTNASPSVNPKRNFVYITAGQKLYFISTKSGKKAYEIDLNSNSENPVINLNGYIYLTDTEGRLYMIDETNRQIKWKFEGFGNRTTAPYLFNGIVHYGTDQGIFYAVGR